MSRNERKIDHVNLARNPSSITPTNDFELIRLVHRSLPETRCDAIDIRTQIASVGLPSPLFINAMTGGSESVTEINENLAILARETGMAMAVGSQHAALRDESVRQSYQVVRQHNRDGVIIANIGAGVPVDYAARAVEMLEASILQVHVNAPQELVMPEGDRDFTGWLDQIARIVDSAKVPVVVKEVGFGMSRETALQLQNIGVQAIDVGGRGGTNFVWIENQRRAEQTFDYLQGWGLSTVESLLEVSSLRDEMTVIASGGIRNPLDAIKCLALGAEAVGMAGYVLRLLHTEGLKAAIQTLQSWHEHVRAICTMLGCQTIAELRTVPLVVQGRVLEWCQQRGIDTAALARCMGS